MDLKFRVLQKKKQLRNTNETNHKRVTDCKNKRPTQTIGHQRHNEEITQTYKHANKQANKQTNKQQNKQNEMIKQTNKQTNTYINKQRKDKHTSEHSDK